MDIAKMQFHVILVCFLAVGCVTTNNFKSLPSESSDFALPYQRLTEKYPEIPAYEKRFRGFSPNTPLAESLTDVWGKPDAVDTEWYYYPVLGGGMAVFGAVLQTGPVPILAAGGLALLIRPAPSETHIWQKGNYCIEVETDKTFPDYKQRVIYWRWTDMCSADRINKACEQPDNKETGK